MITKHLYPVLNDEDRVTEVENCQEAFADNTQTWHLHHKLAITLGLSRKEMREWHIYNGADPEDLIFLKPIDHIRLHAKHRRTKCVSKKY